MSAQILDTATSLDAKALVAEQRMFFSLGETRTLSFRKKQLKTLLTAIKKYEKALSDSLQADLNKSEFEAHGTEIAWVVTEIEHTLNQLDRWATVRSVGTPMFFFGSSSRIMPEPYGIVFIIAPWNYPVRLLLMPLIGAMAAGNTVILKPSELAPHTSHTLSEMIKEYFSPNYIALVEGGVEETQILLKERMDYIFFTGGTGVGRIIYQAAAKYLTPVTLELGGKSPCIVDKNVPIELTAKRIALGKYINAGQTCIAPDYLLIDESVKADFIRAFQEEMKKFLGENPVNNPEFVRIINARHYQRLKAYLSEGDIVAGGRTDDNTRFIEPTLLDNVSTESAVMQEEIFGPILPIISYKNSSEVIDFINMREKPLALYVFSRNNDFVENILQNTSFGGATVNNTLLHIGNGNLPFGGVGASGIGKYHGKTSFDIFSNMKSIMYSGFKIDLPVYYPPFNKISVSKLKTLMRWVAK